MHNASGRRLPGPLALGRVPRRHVTPVCAISTLFQPLARIDLEFGMARASNVVVKHSTVAARHSSAASLDAMASALLRSRWVGMSRAGQRPAGPGSRGGAPAKRPGPPRHNRWPCHCRASGGAVADHKG